MFIVNFNKARCSCNGYYLFCYLIMKNLYQNTLFVQHDSDPKTYIIRLTVTNCVYECNLENSRSTINYHSNKLIISKKVVREKRVIYIKQCSK